MRAERFFAATKGDNLPRQAIAVATAGRAIDHPQLKDTQIAVLDSWHCYGWRWGVAGPEREVYRTGMDTYLFWREVEKLLYKGTCTWLFIMDATVTLDMLGFWDELEAGKLYLSGRDNREGDGRVKDGVPELHNANGWTVLQHQCDAGDGVHQLQGDSASQDRSASEKAKRRPARRMGYCVLEDPPNILLCRRLGRAGSLRIVDMRNYGYSGSDSPRDARGRADWIRGMVYGMCRTLKDNNLGSLQNTAASQALYTWKHSYLRHSVLIHCCPEALHLERQAYYGGRAEAARVGVVRRPVYHVDFRAFYAHIYRELAVPARLVDVSKPTTTGEVLRHMAAYGAIASVCVSTGRAAYPLRRGTEIIYPTGRFWTYLAGPELQYALEHGDAEAIDAVVYYECEPALSDYADAVIAMRKAEEQKGNAAGAEYLKRLAVALPGKFGQTSASWINTTERLACQPYECWCEPDDNGGIKRYRSIAWEVQEEQKSRPFERPQAGSEHYKAWCEAVIRRETGESCPGIAAYVTSAGRLRLWSAIQAVGDGELYYYDTDSLFVDWYGYDNLVRAGMVGDSGNGLLTLRGVYQSFEVHGIKHYVADGRVVCSGLPRGENEPGPDKESYYHRAWIGRALNNGLKPHAQRVVRAYKRQANYQHGRVRSDGKVEPWNLA